ncbi:MAG: glycosyltransferase family 4 protein [Armatimonadia bacterium]
MATEFPPAQGYGLARYASEHCQALVAAGAQVDVICNNYDPQHPRYCEEGVEISNVPFHLPFQGYNSIADILQGNVTLLARAAELLQRQSGIDVIQTHDWLSASAAVALKESFGVPLVVTMHDTELGRAMGKLTPEQQYVAEMEQWLCEKADAVAANSNFIKTELTAAYGVRADRITVAGCGVNPERFHVDVDAADFRSLFCAPGVPLILFVGRLTAIKGPGILLEALREVVKVLPDAQLVLAGDGALKDQLRQHAQEVGLDDHTRFVGHVRGRALAALYRCANVLVVPSLYEPLGMVALEAMICDTPVVAADTGGLAELVQDGQTGFTVPPNDPNALAGAILRMLTSAAEASECIAQARQLAMEGHRWMDVARRSLELYKTVLA